MPCIVVTRKIQCRGHLNFAFHKVSLEFQKNSHHWSIKKVKINNKWSIGPSIIINQWYIDWLVHQKIINQWWTIIEINQWWSIIIDGPLINFKKNHIIGPLVHIIDWLIKWSILLILLVHYSHHWSIIGTLLSVIW